MDVIFLKFWFTITSQNKKYKTITDYPSGFFFYITLTLFTPERYVILLIIAVHCKVVEYGVPRPQNWYHSHRTYIFFISYLLMMSSVLIFSNGSIYM